MKQELLEALLKAQHEKTMESLKDYPEEAVKFPNSVNCKDILQKFGSEMSKEQKQQVMDRIAELTINLFNNWGYQGVLEGCKLSIIVL